MNRNELDWRDMNELPDAGETVLIHVPSDLEPVWFGFWDGRRWHYIEGLPVRSKVTHWCGVPMPPRAAENVVPIGDAIPAVAEAVSEGNLLATVA